MHDLPVRSSSVDFFLFINQMWQLTRGSERQTRAGCSPAEAAGCPVAWCQAAAAAAAATSASLSAGKAEYWVFSNDADNRSAPIGTAACVNTSPYLLASCVIRRHFCWWESVTRWLRPSAIYSSVGRCWVEKTCQTTEHVGDQIVLFTMTLRGCYSGLYKL